MHRNQEGFTLPEILIGLAISSIIIAASFASYIVIKQNYDFQKDMKNISQTSRAVATMIMRDVRIAGYNYNDGPSKENPKIQTPIKITDGGTTAPDSIEIIYDKSYTERLKISYYTKTYNNRLRVYKKVEKCNAMNCASGSLQTIIAESPIADYVEDLQFTGSGKTGCPTNPTPGNFQPNCGVNGIFSPDDGFNPPDDLAGFPVRFAPHTSNRNVRCGGGGDAIDGDFNTYLSCRVKFTPYNNYGVFTFLFNDYVKTEYVHLSTNAHLGCHINNGSCQYFWDPNDGLAYPYGTGPWGGNGKGISVSYQVKVYATTYENGKYGKLLGSASRTVTSSGQNPYMGRYDFNTSEPANAFAVVMYNPRKYDYPPSPSKGTKPRRFSGPSNGNIALPEIQFEGDKWASMENLNVEIGLLIRSPDEHGTSPVSQTFNIGNRPITTNDNYIRDTYTISALVRNSYYGP